MEPSEPSEYNNSNYSDEIEERLLEQRMDTMFERMND